MLDRTVGAPVGKATFVRHGAFFASMSALLIACVFLGFAPTYYLRPASPALGRLALNTLGTPIPGVVGHDLKMSRRVHPASAWGAAAIIATLLFSVAMSNVEAAQSAVKVLAE